MIVYWESFGFVVIKVLIWGKLVMAGLDCLIKKILINEINFLCSIIDLRMLVKLKLVYKIFIKIIIDLYEFKRNNV